MSKHMSKAEGAKLGITIDRAARAAMAPLATRPVEGGVEYTFANETLARVSRRDFINAGKAVSLLSVDGRGYHVFDVYDADAYDAELAERRAIEADARNERDGYGYGRDS